MPFGPPLLHFVLFVLSDLRINLIFFSAPVLGVCPSCWCLSAGYLFRVLLKAQKLSCMFPSFSPLFCLFVRVSYV